MIRAILLAAALALAGPDPAVHAAATAPVELSALLAEADRFLDSKDPAAALATLDRAKEEEKESRPLLHRRAVALAMLGRHEEALPLRAKLLAADRADPEAWTNYGVSLGLSGRKAEALEAFAAAVARDPANAEALANLGVSYGQLGRFTDEVATLERACLAAPHNANLFYNLGVALGHLGRTTEEIAAYRDALARRADLAAARENLAVSLLQAGDPAAAAAEFERLVRDADPNRASYWYGLGSARLSLGDLTAAGAAAERLKAIDWPLAARLLERIKAAK